MNSSKLALTITAVVLVHLVAGTVILLQPGCKSDGQKATTTPPPAEAANATVATATPELAEPTRPAPITPSTPVPEETMTSSEPLPSTTDINGTGPVAAATGPTSTYEVKKGDSLSKIAHAEKVSLKDLMAANSLTSTSKLKVGQTLTIPASAGSAAPTPTTTTSTSTAAAPADASATGSTHSYTVKSGDSLSKIAHKNGTTVAAIKAANHLTSDSITVGKVLTLPGEGTASTSTSTDSTLSAPTAPSTSTSSATPAATDGSGVYVVKSGDRLDTIAKKNGVKVSELMTLNNITNPQKLQIGQKLKLPTPGTASTATTAPTASSATPPAATPLSSVNAVSPAPANSTTPPPSSPADNVPVTPVTN